MVELSKSRVFGADPNDERYFELAKYAFDCATKQLDPHDPELSDNTTEFFSPEFQKKVFYFEETVNVADGTEFKNFSTRSVTRFSHVRKYQNDIFVQVLQYKFRFVANNSEHVKINVYDYTIITDFVGDYKDWARVKYNVDDIIAINFCID